MKTSTNIENTPLKELHGKWHSNNMPRHGWIKPCYICDSYTGQYYKILIYEVYMCSSCLPLTLRNNAQLLTKFIIQLELFIFTKENDK